MKEIVLLQYKEAIFAWLSAIKAKNNTMGQLEEILDQHRDQKGALLPILHDVQQAFGYVSEDNIREIANALNLTRAEVYGVVSFYHDFHLEPGQKKPVKLCQAEACQARGVHALLAGLSDDERDRVEAVYCLGLCSVGPAALTHKGCVHARLNTDSLSQLVDQA